MSDELTRYNEMMARRETFRFEMLKDNAVETVINYDNNTNNVEDDPLGVFYSLARQVGTVSAIERYDSGDELNIPETVPEDDMKWIKQKAMYYLGDDFSEFQFNKEFVQNDILHFNSKAFAEELKKQEEAFNAA